MNWWCHRNSFESWYNNWGVSLCGYMEKKRKEIKRGKHPLREEHGTWAAGDELDPTGASRDAKSHH